MSIHDVRDILFDVTKLMFKFLYNNSLEFRYIDAIKKLLNYFYDIVINTDEPNTDLADDIIRLNESMNYRMM